MSQANVHKIVSRFRKCVRKRLDARPARTRIRPRPELSDGRRRPRAPLGVHRRAQGRRRGGPARLSRAGRGPRPRRAGDPDRRLPRPLAGTGVGRRRSTRARPPSGWPRSSRRSLAHGSAGWWPTMLPRLRKRHWNPAQAGGRAAERGARGRGPRGEGRRLLPPRWSTGRSTPPASRSGCSTRSARSTAPSAEKLREIGEPIGEGRAPGAPAPAMARVAYPKSAETSGRGRRADEARAGGAGARTRRDRRDVHGRPLSGPSVSCRRGECQARGGPHDYEAMTYQAASRPFLLFRFALREGDFVLARLIARALWRGRRRGQGRRATGLGSGSMEEIETRAEAILAELPDYIWSGDRPPIPIEEIADSHFDLYVRRVSPERDARRARLSRTGRRRGALRPPAPEPGRDLGQRRGGRAVAPSASGSRSPTSSATTSCTRPASRRCSAASRASIPRTSPPPPASRCR